MTAINYVKGDATQPQGPGVKIICHICNDLGAWGAGFVLAVSRRWLRPEEDYRKWYRDRNVTEDFALGNVKFVQVEDDIYVANMIAQKGLGYGTDGPPIRYLALAECLDKVADFAKELASIHMPRIGCGLAGGSWSKVEGLIQDYLCNRELSVTVYDLPD